MKKQYLVIDNSKNKLLSISDQYQLFDDRALALEQYKAIGGDDSWMPITDVVGRASMEKCGDRDILFIPIEAKAV